MQQSTTENEVCNAQPGQINSVPTGVFGGFFFCRAGCCKCQAHAVVTWIRVFALHKLSSSDIISIINDMGTTVIATIFSSYCFSVYLLDFIKFSL